MVPLSDLRDVYSALLRLHQDADTDLEWFTRKSISGVLDLRSGKLSKKYLVALEELRSRNLVRRRRTGRAYEYRLSDPNRDFYSSLPGDPGTPSPDEDTPLR